MKCAEMRVFTLISVLAVGGSESIFISETLHARNIRHALTRQETLSSKPCGLIKLRLFKIKMHETT